MQDREPQVGREGRVRITQDDGTVIEGVLEMADNATIQGTPYNKATQLSDAVAQALKLTPVEKATVNDALGLLPGVISNLNETQLSMLTMERGEYTGNGKYGSANPTSITFSFVPDIVFIIEQNNSATVQGYQATFFPKNSQVKQWSITGPTGDASLNISGMYQNLSLSGNTLSWYSVNSSHQMNKNNKSYSWYAIGQKFDNTVTVSCKNSSGALQDGCVVTLGENDPVVSNSTEPLVFKTVSSAPVLTVVSPLDYGGVVQTQTLDLSNTQNLSVDVNVDTSTHLTSGTINASVSGAFSSQVTSVDVFCLGGGGNGRYSTYLMGYYPQGGICTGGSGGGYALKNAVDVSANKPVTIIPGGRSGTSRVQVSGVTVCEATGGQNGASRSEQYPAPGNGTVGDTLLTGARAGYFKKNTGGDFDTTQGAAGEYSTDPFSGEAIGGAGYGDAVSVTQTTTYTAEVPAVQNGGGGTPLQQDATAPGAGGGGLIEGYRSGGSPDFGKAGLGTAGYVKWRVAQ